jgi:hypothetical protein
MGNVTNLWIDLCESLVDGDLQWTQAVLRDMMSGDSLSSFTASMPHNSCFYISPNSFHGLAWIGQLMGKTLLQKIK